MRMFAVAVLLVAAGGVAYTQYTPPDAPQKVRPRPEQPSLAEPDTIPKTSVPSTVQPDTKSAPADKAIDQLLDRLESLRAQKAELEKAEAEVVKEIRRKLEKQSDRINRLGIFPAGPLTPGNAAQPPSDIPIVPPTNILPPLGVSPRP